MKYFVLLFFIFLTSIMAEGRCKAILINGGGDPANNFNVHTSQLREMYNTLIAKGCSEKDLHVFSASGSTESADFRIDPTAANSRFVASAYRFNGNSRVPNLYPADAATLKKKIAEISRGFSEDDKVFVYVADHGGNINGTKGLVPWSAPGEPPGLVTPQELEAALQNAPARTSIKLWTECCFCGVFNRIKRPNTCVATSTDEYHVGSYDWNNWKTYIGKPEARLLSSNAYFAGHVKKSNPQVSLASAARVTTNLMQDNRDILAATFDQGCFIGPRDSLEQYMFGALGFANKQACLPEVAALFGQGQKTKDTRDCETQSGLSDIKSLQSYLESMKQGNSRLNYSDRTKLDKLIAEIKNFRSVVLASPEYARIQRLTKDFDSLSDKDKVSQAIAYQIQVSELKTVITKKYNKNEILLKNQRLIMESLFFTKATAAQRSEYNRRKACLDEPLF